MYVFAGPPVTISVASLLIAVPPTTKAGGLFRHTVRSWSQTINHGSACPYLTFDGLELARNANVVRARVLPVGAVPARVLLVPFTRWCGMSVSE